MSSDDLQRLSSAGGSMEDVARAGHTRVDDYPLIAGLVLMLGGLPTIVYYFAFQDAWATPLPWKISAATTIIAACVAIAHYALNRKARRLFWEGGAAIIAMIPTWLLVGSWWFFYFMFAPMPFEIRGVALVLCFIGTAYWLIIAWRDYAKDVVSRDLIPQLYKEKSDSIVYPSSVSDMVIATLKQRNPFTRLHYVVATVLGPVAIAISMVYSENFKSSHGPHVIFIILSFLSFPFSQWMLAYLGVRTLYFHICLPMKLERARGKKVILGG